MTDWNIHWNTKITHLDPNNWWIPQLKNEDYKTGYNHGFQDGYRKGRDSIEHIWNKDIDSIISDLESLKV